MQGDKAGFHSSNSMLGTVTEGDALGWNNGAQMALGGACYPKGKVAND
jgi:hypothetical protein